MAKKAASGKETSLPLVFALVFFVLSTITFGVLWYMQYADQEAKIASAADAKKDAAAARQLAKEADLNAKLYRIYLGVDDPEDRTLLLGEHKAGDKLSTELKLINDRLATKLGKADASALPAELQVWTVDESGKLGEAPTKTFVEAVTEAMKERDAAKVEEKKSSDLYKASVSDYKKAQDELEAARKIFAEVAASLPKDYKAKLDAQVKLFEDRKQKFIADEAAGRKELDGVMDAKGQLERETKRQKELMSQLQEQIGVLIKERAKTQVNQFAFEEPQGKILRRPESGIVEINLGSADLVRPGLTFTVLPNDYQEKGRQSRVRIMRVPDERGVYKNVERFVEKATIEVIEVVGPHLARARVTQEFDPIRDGAAPGDLLYNSVWRKGTADHIALVGIFDVNGDGSDDIEAVIRDLNRMGVPVDAYFDMRTRKWVGQINEQTRYVIEGWYPANSANDPNRDDKTKLIAAMTAAVQSGRDKGVAIVKFQDFFPRMGYRMKLDMNVDKLNQAVAPYLNRVNAVENPPMKDGN
ncbi:Uncharacterized protein OS=Planctomyces maris DSM 8797 GN=PM8797T_24106 PE=4 SV=1 [Gemmataceae bacterium]|nr:Uncharacterized protein OS=Planctomyces maris DSM 8797 GN=PM8797T_24106 PE=4 SV=1 [Gemmataceae bacterium]VTT98654.1 Uncharacterized protein OS=Planctomyces maris DSM 8797 GN=PM8797T_24106 PE=4 SV=1 [Gemmataceae bacterium]